jgi:hypothetical protein
MHEWISGQDQRPFTKQYEFTTVWPMMQSFFDSSYVLDYNNGRDIKKTTREDG